MSAYRRPGGRGALVVRRLSWSALAVLVLGALVASAPSLRPQRPPVQPALVAKKLPVQASVESDVTNCQAGPLSLQYNLPYNAAVGTYVVQSVIAAGIDTDCIGATLMVVLADANGDVVTRSVHDVEGTTQAVTYDPPPAVSQIYAAHVEIGTTTLSCGNGNFHGDLGDFDYTIVCGNGKITISVGDGNNTIQLGSGNINLRLGSGSNVVTVQNGVVHLTAGGNTAFFLGKGSGTVDGGGTGSSICHVPTQHYSYVISHCTVVTP